MRSFFRSFLLLALLLAYGTQAIEQGQHDHVAGDRHHCTACVFGALPGEPASTIEEPIPPEVLQLDQGIQARRTPPPSSLEPLDVSFSTSPPLA